MGFGIATQTGVSAAIQSIPSMMANKGLRNGYGATFAENFTDGTNTLDPRITFSRASNATVTGSNGLIQYAPHNLLTYSEQFDNAAWNKSTVTVTANTTVAPDGTTTADTFTPSSTTGTVYTSISASATTYTLSAYGKGSGSLVMFFTTAGFALGSGCSFNLSTGVASAVVNYGATTGSTATITSVGNGWYRCSLTVLATAATYLPTIGCGSATANSIWGAQLNVGSLQPYYPTTVKNLLGYSEAFDNAAWTKTNSFVQTNLLTYSEQFDNAVWGKGNMTVTANSIEAPNGTTTADTLVENTTASAFHYVNAPSITKAASAIQYTASIYVKAKGRQIGMSIASGAGGAVGRFNPDTGVITLAASSYGTWTAQSFTATAVGNGWYRCVLTGTSDTATSFTLQISTWNTELNTNVYTGDGVSGFYVWGAQLVQGSVAGDYQQTTSAALPVMYQAPNGTFTADKLVEDTANSTHFARQTPTGTVNTSPYTISVYAKAAERSYLGLALQEGSPFTRQSNVNFNLANGTVGAVSSLGGSVGTASMTPVGNGWYRCSLTVTLGGSATSILAWNYISTAGGFTYQGDGTSGIYIWGAQLSDSASLDPYVNNPVAAPTAAAYYGARFDYDPVTLQPKGLLIEEQRTNLLTNSISFATTWTGFGASVASSTTVSPDGSNAVKLVESATTAEHGIFQTTTTSGSNAYSVYLKYNGRRYAVLRRDGGTAVGIAVFDLQSGLVTQETSCTASITAVGNGWYRCSMVCSTATGNTVIKGSDVGTGVVVASTYTGDGVSGFFMYGAQLEAGAFATSYIPTTASQVTRSADVALIQGSNFSGWYNVNQGSFVTNTQLYNATARNAAGFDVQDGTTNNRIIFRAITTGSADQMVVRSGGTTVATLSSASVSTPARKTGMGVKLDDFAMVSQGGDIYSDNSGAMPVGVSQMLLGSATGGAEFLNGYIRSIAYYPTRLQNSQLQAVTQ